jgi:hypothetical protein
LLLLGNQARRLFRVQYVLCGGMPKFFVMTFLSSKHG